MLGRMSTARLLLLFVLLLTLAAIAVLLLAAINGWQLGEIGAALFGFVSFVLGLLMRSPWTAAFGKTEGS